MFGQTYDGAISEAPFHESHGASRISSENQSCPGRVAHEYLLTVA